MTDLPRHAQLLPAICLVLVLAWAGQADADADPPDRVDPVEPIQQPIYTHQCAGGKKISAVVELGELGHARTVLSVEGDVSLQNIEMQQVMAASGFKSSNGKLIWWTRGREGFLAEEDPTGAVAEILIDDCVEICCE